MNGKVALIGLAHPFEEGFSEATQLLNETANSIQRTGTDCINTGIVISNSETVNQASNILKSQDYDALVICVATWSEDHHLFDLLATIHKPLILRAYPAKKTGSLCCVHQIACVLTELNQRYDYVYGEACDLKSAEKINALAMVYRLVATMRSIKVGAIGGRVGGMTEIAYDEFDLMNKIGARVVNLDESELTEGVAAISDKAAKIAFQELGLDARGCKILSSQTDLIESIKYYLAMKSLVVTYDLGALAIKCYTKYMGKICLGYSLLAEEGIACACEGDVPNALTMKLLSLLSNCPVNNTDLLYPDQKDNTILFSHCGSSGMSIAEGVVELAPVRLANCGVCAKFIPRTGRVTLANLCGHGDNLRLSVMLGEAVKCGMEFDGNPAKVQFEKPVLDLCEEIAEIGIGHHWMIGYGDMTEALRKFCELQKISIFQL